MEANKMTTQIARRDMVGTVSLLKENSFFQPQHSIKIILLVGLVLLVYKTCLSEGKDSVMTIYKGATMVKIDTSFNTADSNRKDSMVYAAQASYDVCTAADMANGSIQDSLDFIAKENKTTADSMVNSYFLGIEAADTSYRIKKSHKWEVILITAVASPLLSVIPVAIASSTVPEANLLHTDPSMLNNEAYMKGFMYEVHYIKKRSLWAAFVKGGTPWCMIMGFLTL